MLRKKEKFFKKGSALGHLIIVLALTIFLLNIRLIYLLVKDGWFELAGLIIVKLLLFNVLFIIIKRDIERGN